MQALVLEQFNQPLVLRQVPDPVCGPMDVVLKVLACGICGTDLKIKQGKLPKEVIRLPHIMGHEIAGQVVEIGKQVSSIQQGDKGIAYFYLPCRDCEMCRRGKENLCYSIQRLGFEKNGGYAQYVSLPAYNFLPVADMGDPAPMAVLSDAAATVYHAVKTRAKVRPGQKVLIIGTGGLGLHAIQFIQLAGADSIAVDIRPNALKTAVEMGTEWAVNPEKENPVQSVLDITHGRGVDVVLDIVGNAQTLDWSLKSLKRDGRLVLVGYDPVNPLPLPAMALHYNEWRIYGTRVSTKQELLEVVELAKGGRIRPILAKTPNWREAEACLEALRAGEDVGRYVLTFP